MSSLAAHDVAHVRAENPGPYTLTGTNSWIVGRDPAYVIDPGPPIGANVDALAAELARRGGAGAILLTHDHIDHSGAIGALRALIGLDVPLAAMRGEADIALEEGVAVGPLRTMIARGHAPDHVVFIADGVCFSGDLVLGSGSVQLSPDPGALVDYLAALRRLRSLDLELIAPGHGPLVTEPSAKLDDYLAHRLDRERRLLEALADGVRGHDALLERVWSEVPATLRAGAVSTLEAHLDKLAGEGRLPGG